MIIHPTMLTHRNAPPCDATRAGEGGGQVQVKVRAHAGHVRLGQVESGAVSCSQVRSGAVRSGQVRCSQVLSGLVRSGSLR